MPVYLDEGFHFLAFLDRGRLVHHEHHIRPNGDFRGLQREVGSPTVVAVDAAKFEVEKTSETRDGRPYFFLKPLQ